MKKLIAALALLLALTLAFAACAKPAEPTTEAAPDTTAAEPVSETESEAPAEKAAVNLGLLKGPTGMGAAYLLQQNADGKALNDYTNRNKMQIIATKVIFNEDGSETYEFTIRMNADMTINDLLTFLESIEGVRALSCELGS